MGLLKRALHELASRCDGAGADDGQGFNKMDTHFGKSLAGRAAHDELSPKQRRAAWRMLLKYKGQLAGYGIDYDAIPEPPLAEDRSRGGIKFMGIKDGNILVQFDYRQDIVAAIKSFPKQNRRYNPDTKTWLLIPAVSICEDIVDFASRYDFEVDPEVYNLLSGLAEQQARLLEGSRAVSSTLVICGLGGELYPFQVAGVEYAVAAERTFIADQMRMGKTPQALAVIHVKNAFPALIICPATVKYVWAAHILEWLPGRTVAMVKGRKFYRVLAGNGDRIYLEKDEYDLPGAYDIVIINYDMLRPRPNRWVCTEGFTNTKGRVYECGDYIMERLKGFKRDELELVKRHFKRDGYGKSKNGLIEKFLNIGLQSLIIDESQMIKESKAQRTQACTQLSEGVPIRLLLSGTPFLNRPAELISQLIVLDRLKDFGGFWGFGKRYCNFHQTRFGLDKSGAQNLGELNHLLRSICYIRRTRAQVFPELPPKQRENILVDLANREEYEEAEADLIAWLEENAKVENEFHESIKHLDEEEQADAIIEYRMSAAARAARAIRLVRIEILKQICAKGKLSMAIAWISDFIDTGEKLVVFANHINIQKEIFGNFDGSAHIFGEDDAAVRQKNIERFQNDSDCRLIVCSLKAAGVGISLAAASDVFFIELGWGPAEMDQAEDRPYHPGKKDSIMAWYLLARDSIDIDIQELINEKRVVVDAATEGEADPGQQTSIMDGLIGRLIK